MSYIEIYMFWHNNDKLNGLWTLRRCVCWDLAVKEIPASEPHFWLGKVEGRGGGWAFLKQSRSELLSLRALARCDVFPVRQIKRTPPAPGGHARRYLCLVVSLGITAKARAP